jgi:hypothetical protein
LNLGFRGLGTPWPLLTLTKLCSVPSVGAINVHKV